MPEETSKDVTTGVDTHPVGCELGVNSSADCTAPAINKTIPPVSNLDLVVICMV